MTDREGEVRRVRAGVVGRPHGLDGSFHLETPGEPLQVGTPVTVGGRRTEVTRMAGTATRPIVRLEAIVDREAAERLRGQALEIDQTDGDLADGEYFAADLVGCEVTGVGVVRRVITAPSCDLLEAGEDGVLIPFISDAIKRVDLATRTIDVDRVFLALDGEDRTA